MRKITGNLEAYLMRIQYSKAAVPGSNDSTYSLWHGEEQKMNRMRRRVSSAVEKYK